MIHVPEVLQFGDRGDGHFSNFVFWDDTHYAKNNRNFATAEPSRVLLHAEKGYTNNPFLFVFLIFGSLLATVA